MLPMPRPKGEITRVSVCGAVMPDVESEILAIAAREDRSKSSVVEKLLIRGLAAYRRDGSLTEPEETETIETHGRPVTIFSETPPKKKKSVK